MVQKSLQGSAGDLRVGLLGIAKNIVAGGSVSARLGRHERMTLWWMVEKDFDVAHWGPSV
jgi:hypothetical protein